MFFFYLVSNISTFFGKAAPLWRQGFQDIQRPRYHQSSSFHQQLLQVIRGVAPLPWGPSELQQWYPQTNSLRTWKWPIEIVDIFTHETWWCSMIFHGFLCVFQGKKKSIIEIVDFYLWKPMKIIGWFSTAGMMRLLLNHQRVDAAIFSPNWHSYGKTAKNCQLVDD